MEARPAVEAELRFPGANVPAGPGANSIRANVPSDAEMQSPGTDVPFVNGPKVDKLDAGSTGVDK